MNESKRSKEKPLCAFVVKRSFVGKKSLSDMVIDLILSAYGKREAEIKDKKVG